MVKTRADLGFRYHAITFAVMGPISIAATALAGESVWPQLVGLAGWGVGLYLHSLYSRRTLKGLAADEAFP